MSTVNANLTYNYKVVRQFAIMTVVWGIVGMALGVLIAAQLVWPSLNLDLPFTHFVRLRPLHTNAVIFGFGGSALFATSYYVVQRTCQARLISDGLASFTFWGWQAIIVAAAITLPLGLTSSKEYAELEWPIDIAIAIVWVTALVFFGTVMKRSTPTFMWPTGSTAHSSLPLHACTSVTTWRCPPVLSSLTLPMPALPTR